MFLGQLARGVATLEAVALCPPRVSPLGPRDRQKGALEPRGAELATRRIDAPVLKERPDGPRDRLLAPAPGGLHRPPGQLEREPLRPARAHRGGPDGGREPPFPRGAH